jgi:hypothetical protein
MNHHVSISCPTKYKSSINSRQKFNPLRSIITYIIQCASSFAQPFSSLQYHTLVHLHLEILTIAPLASPESLDTRQIGNIQCNVARLKTVGALKKAQTAVKTLAANATFVL